MGRPCAGVLVDLVVAELLASGNVLAADSVVHIGLDATGGNAVDCDLLLTSICRSSARVCQKIAGALTDSHAPGEGLDGTLGARVDGVLGHTLGLTSDGSHKDDAAANFHPLVRLLGDEELTTSVDVEDTVELLRLDVGEVTERDDTRVGTADVEAAEVCNNIVHQLGGLLYIANVGLEGVGISTVAERLNLLDDCLSALNSISVVDGDLSTALAELNSHRLSDTTACEMLVGDAGDSFTF